MGTEASECQLEIGRQHLPHHTDVELHMYFFYENCQPYHAVVSFYFLSPSLIKQ